MFVAVVGVVVAAYLLYYNFYGNHHIKTENAYTTGDQNLVTAQISGSIIDLKIKNTDKVEKGQMIAKIEDTDYILKLEGAKVNLSKTVRDYYSIDTRTVRDMETLNSAQSNYNTIDKDYQRETELYRAGLISRQKMEGIENDYINAKNSLKQAKNNMKIASSSQNLQGLRIIRR